MRPGDLHENLFATYPPEGRAFAIQYLNLLRKLPMSICPFFLGQIKSVSTSFPVERSALHQQCDFLTNLPDMSFHALMMPLVHIAVSEQLAERNWVDDPGSFTNQLTAELWKTGAIGEFRTASIGMFAAIPAAAGVPKDRLIITVQGKGAVMPKLPFGKLRKHGVELTKLQDPDIPQALLELFRSYAPGSSSGYTKWYMDGGSAWDLRNNDSDVVQASYASLTPLRTSILSHMQDAVVSGDSGTEAMHQSLSMLTPYSLNAQMLTPDPVLQRFYTELFTLGSGTQFFSTTFLQWAGRELMRRAEPQSVLLRYAPRQQHRPFNDMLSDVEKETTLDPEGSLRDAEMGCYYALLDAQKMPLTGRLTFLCWWEGTSSLLIVAPSAPAGTQINSPLRLAEALRELT